MVLAHAMWVHGHSLQAETERLNVERRGFHARCQGAATNEWVHFAIPTPVIVNGERLRAGSILVRFVTGGAHGTGAIRAIHVWDGEKRIVTKEYDHLTAKDWCTERIDVPGHPSVAWGIGVSILLSLDNPDIAGNWVNFSGVGCDFYSGSE
jgi:hypothetical protein